MFLIPFARYSFPHRHALLLAAVLVWSGCGESKPRSDAAPAAVPQSGASETEAGLLTLEPGFQWIAFAECKTFPEEAAVSWSAPDERTFATTGKPKSYLYTDKEFGNFTLRYDYRFPSPPTDPAKAPLANTGVLLFIQPPHAIWPKALEVQGKFVEMGAIRPNGGAAEVPVKEEADIRESARFVSPRLTLYAVSPQLRQSSVSSRAFTQFLRERFATAGVAAYA